MESIALLLRDTYKVSFSQELLVCVTVSFPALKEKFEKDFIIKALKAFNGRINQTALHTQMTKVTLLRKLEKYGINPRDYTAQR